MSTIRTILGVVDSLSQLFTSKQPQQVERPKVPRLDDLTSDDLTRERIRLEQEEKKLLKTVEQYEAEKRAAFEQATRESSVRKQKIMARKIKELDTRANNVDRNLRVVSQQLRIINGFIQVKENKRIWEQSGLWTQISQMDLSELEAYVTDSMIEGSFNSDKFGNIIQALEGSEGLVDEMEEDADVLDILSEIQAVAAVRDGEPSAVEEGLARVEERLHRKEEEEEDYEVL
jgi:hypothetical protein